jgi:hypothetical protein
MMESVFMLPKDKQIISCILLWEWWNARNKINAGEAEHSTSHVCKIIQKHVFKFQQVQPTSLGVGQVETGEMIEEEVLWKKPDRDQVKINMDADFWEPLGSGAWGFIARDDRGEFVAAAAGKLRHLRSALQAETEACVAAVEGAVALGLNRVVFELD